MMQAKPKVPAFKIVVMVAIVATVEYRVLYKFLSSELVHVWVSPFERRYLRAANTKLNPGINRLGDSPRQLSAHSDLLQPPMKQESFAGWSHNGGSGSNDPNTRNAASHETLTKPSPVEGIVSRNMTVSHANESLTPLVVTGENRSMVLVHVGKAGKHGGTSS